jgi:hypothetical protein
MQVFTDIFKFGSDITARIKNIVNIPKAFSWQTFIYLSVFSGLMSYLASGFVKDLISLCGWLFLIAGTAWYTTDGNPLKFFGTDMTVGALITGALVSIFAFGHESTILTSRTFVLWPTIAGLISAVPEFFSGTGTDVSAQIPKPEARQRMIILVASCMVLSCWLQFFFVMDNWLNEYPSLKSDSFKNSTFVLRTQPPETVPENGALVLNKIQPLLEEQLTERNWSEAEKWLKNASSQVGKLGREVVDKQLQKFDEKSFWKIEPRITNTKSGYKLDILSIWTGPSSNPKKYYLKKSCTVEPFAGGVRTNKPDAKGTVAEIICERGSSLFGGSPPPQQ